MDMYPFGALLAVKTVLMKVVGKRDVDRRSITYTVFFFLRSAPLSTKRPKRPFGERETTNLAITENARRFY
jgi:hypothetical protein